MHENLEEYGGCTEWLAPGATVQGVQGAQHVPDSPKEVPLHGEPTGAGHQ